MPNHVHIHSMVYKSEVYYLGIMRQVFFTSKFHSKLPILSCPVATFVRLVETMAAEWQITHACIIEREVLCFDVAFARLSDLLLCIHSLNQPEN